MLSAMFSVPAHSFDERCLLPVWALCYHVLQLPYPYFWLAQHFSTVLLALVCLWHGNAGGWGQALPLVTVEKRCHILAACAHAAYILSELKCSQGCHGESFFFQKPWTPLYDFAWLEFCRWSWYSIPIPVSLEHSCATTPKREGKSRLRNGHALCGRFFEQATRLSKTYCIHLSQKQYVPFSLSLISRRSLRVGPHTEAGLSSTCFCEKRVSCLKVSVLCFHFPPFCVYKACFLIML